MEIYSTEEQQLQAVKGILQRYWIAIAVAIVVVIAAAIGWSIYQSHQSQKTVLASQAYQHLLLESAKGNDVTAEALEQFISTYQGAGNYAQLAQLILANKQVAQKQYKEASVTLQRVIARSEQPVQGLAVIRLARVLIQLKQYDNALATLRQLKGKAFKGIVAALNGDIYVAQGTPDSIKAARDSYQDAIADGQGIDPTVQLKLDNLAGE
ncbi:YfgM family protein [Celerinatantimonas sp. YJH-8]|uniref:YfgM family protein n=1 Tax=Celerinatantimonas sp. YJH-8 TaxID=3228714 RepID=UPI0038C6D2E7